MKILSSKILSSRWTIVESGLKHEIQHEVHISANVLSCLQSTSQNLALFLEVFLFCQFLTNHFSVCTTVNRKSQSINILSNPDELQLFPEE